MESDLATLLAEIARLQPPLNAVVRTLFPFIISGLISIWLALSLIYLNIHTNDAGQRWARRHRLLYRSVLFFHAFPLLFGVPITTGMALSALSLSGFTTLGQLQNDYTLAAFGIILYTFVAYALLEHILRIREKLVGAGRILHNMREEHWIRRGAVVAYIVMPPAALTLGILIVMQNAMYAAPKFLTRPNAMVYLNQAMAHMEASIGYRAVTAVIVAAGIAIFLAGLYYVTQITMRTIVGLVSRKRIRAREHSRLLRPKISVGLRRLLLATAVGSSLFFLVLAVGVLLGLGLSVAEGLALERRADPSGILRSLLTPGPVSAVIATSIVWVLAIRYRSRRLRTNEHPWLFAAVTIVAFLPPALYGSLLLPFVTPASRLLLTWGATLSWSAGIFLLVCYAPIFEDRHTPLVNVGLLGLPFSRRILTVGAGPLGGFAPQVVLVAFLLWVEEGLQITLNVENTLAANLYRDQAGEWSTAALVGLIVAVGIWLIVMAASAALQPLFRCLIQKKLRPARAYIMIVGSLCSLFLAKDSIAQRVDIEELHIGLREESVRLPSGSSVRVHTLTITNESIIYFELPETLRELIIDTIVIKTPRPPEIRLRGNGEAVDAIIIRSIKFEVDTYRVMLLRLEQLPTKLIEISNPGPGAETSTADPTRRFQLEFDAESASEAVRLRSLRLASAIVMIRPASSEETISQVELIGVQASRIEIQGVGAPSILLTVDCGLWESPATGIPRVSIEDLTWLGGDITLKPASQEQKVIVELAHADYRNQGESEINLESFPEAELRWSASTMDGAVKIRAHDLDQLTLNHLRPSEAFAEASISIEAQSFNSVGLSGLELSELAIRGAAGPGDSWYFTTLQDVIVNQRIAVPRSFLRSAVEQRAGSAQARQFMYTLQDYGVYTDDNSPVGFDAVYHRNLAEMTSIFPPVAWLLDALTGLGIELKKPLISFLIYSLIYLALIVFIIRYTNDPSRMSWPRTIGNAFILPLTMEYNDALNTSNQKWISVIVNIYRFVLLIQTTLVTLYLGETALGL